MKYEVCRTHGTCNDESVEYHLEIIENGKGTGRFIVITADLRPDDLYISPLKRFTIEVD